MVLEAFINDYIQELGDNLRRIDEGSIILKKDKNNEEELNKILRVLHKVKGSSNMLGFHNIAKITHGLENVFKGVQDKRYEISINLIQLVFITTDYLRYGLNQIKTTNKDDVPFEKLLSIFNKAYANEPYSLEGLRLQKEEKSQSSGMQSTKEPQKKEKKEVQRPESSSTTEDYQSIRIQLDQIDSIIKSVNNLIIKQFQLKKNYELINNVEQEWNHLSSILKNIEIQNDSQTNPVKLDSKNLLDITKEIQKFKKNFFEQMNVVERDTLALQKEIFSLRMFPLEMIMGSLAKMVEEIAIELGKEIDFNITGKEVKLDKAILENLQDPIIHIVRNSIDHGVESPEVRLKKGKKKSGTIQINCYSEGGNIIIEIKDDGKGFNYSRIKSKAMKLNPSNANEIRIMKPADLNQFIFMPSFSTKTKVTSLSGRGVGLDIVKYNIEKLKGKIDVESKQDEGVKFTLTLPLSLATVDGYFIMVSNKKFFLSANFIKEIRIIKKKEKMKLFNKQAFKLRDKVVPLYYMSHILGLSDKDEEAEKYFVIVIESVGEVVGLIVDHVIEYASLIYKPVPKNLSKQKIIQGIVFDESFNIVTILYAPTLIRKVKTIRHIDITRQISKQTRRQKYILVVDDSLNTREILKSILEMENYIVYTAVDGIDALTKVKQKPFKLIITDINMPKMNGITFIDNLKREEKYTNIPVVVISSFEAKKYQNQLSQLGISHYIEKSDFDRNNLTKLIKELIG